jgi:hypothetical protein
VDHLLYELNSIWLKREEKTIGNIKEYYKNKIKELKREVSA